MRGERNLLLWVAPEQLGSSPHARGTLTALELNRYPFRFIPACAGNATGCLNGRRLPSVHPRMRGERSPVLMIVRISGGSSPHARGTHGWTGSRKRSLRFIPACAGNASVQAAIVGKVAVHPRMRGERLTEEDIEQATAGSSPHARGTRAHPALEGIGVRFIPACAGNASGISGPASTEPVHPRMRGERYARRIRSWPFGGSSPHARGTHFQ